MKYAIYYGNKLRAEQAGSGAIGVCPQSGRRVKARVGKIRQYWAHFKENLVLESGYNPEGEWHKRLKIPIKNEFSEVYFGQNNEHIADIVGNYNTVIEIQKSTIDVREVIARIKFYYKETGKKVIWIVDIQDFWNQSFFLRPSQNQGQSLVEWQPITTWIQKIAHTPHAHLYLEFCEKDDRLLHVWGYAGRMYAKKFPKMEFFNRYMSGVAKPEYRNNPQKAVDLWCKKHNHLNPKSIK